MTDNAEIENADIRHIDEENTEAEKTQARNSMRSRVDSKDLERIGEIDFGLHLHL